MSEVSSGSAGMGVPGMREDLLHHDPLLDCLVELTRIHGRPSTRAALVAGLPLEKGSLTPSLFSRAASRAGLSAKVVKRSLARIDDALLPVVLLLDGEEACVLLGWDDSGEMARLLFLKPAKAPFSFPGKSWLGGIPASRYLPGHISVLTVVRHRLAISDSGTGSGGRWPTSGLFIGMCSAPHC